MEIGTAEIVQPIEIRGEKLGEVSLAGVQLVDEKSMELITPITRTFGRTY